MTEPPVVAVTGAAGFVGRQVVALQAADPSRRVVAVDHRWDGPRVLAQALGEGPIERAIHLGWYARPADYLTSVRGNLDSLERSVELVEALAQRGCRHLVVAGTCAEYGPTDAVLDEGAPVDPWSVYGATKASFHLLLQSSLRPEGLAVAWCRIFHVSGPGEAPERPLPAVARRLLAGEAAALTDGEQVRDYLDVADVAAALVAASDHEVVGTYNVCSGTPVAMRTIFDQLAASVGRPDLLAYGARPRGPRDLDRVVGTSARLRDATGWRPRHSVTDLVERVVHDVRTRPSEANA